MNKNRHPDFRVRIPEELKEKIRASAEEYNRSMGADIIARLEQSFESESALNNDSEVESIKEQLDSMSEAYRQTQHRFDKLFKLFENDIDLSSYLVQKTAKEKPTD